MERKEFLSLVGISVGAVMLQHCLSGCSKSSDPSPTTTGGTTGGTGGTTTAGFSGNATASKGTINFTLDLTAASYTSLATNGNAKVVDDVIVAKTSAGNYIAVSKACTHEGTTIDFFSALNKFRCSTHGSEFSTTGSVLAGPATSPLTQYQATFDSSKNTLTVKA